MNNLIFLGGIHGVGKDTICRDICKQTGLIHKTASEILKWEEISTSNNKNVDDVQDTQDRLVKNLQKVIDKKKQYLLDGHFCLLNSDNEIERIPIKTFEKIAPRVIAVASTKIFLVKARLENRDNKIYDFDLLDKMQKTEIDYAQIISAQLKVPFIQIKDGNYQSLIRLL